MLLVEDRKHGLGRLFEFGPQDGMGIVLRVIDETLKRDRRFSSIRWFTKQEYESGRHGGAHSPFEGEKESAS